MKTMKIQKLLMLAFLFAGLGLFSTSCQEEPCEDVTCLNGGECMDGDCECPERYTGDECETDKCENVGCENGSYAINSADTCECRCDTGYEGDSCNTEMRAKFLGTYLISDNCDSEDYNSTISKSSQQVSKVLVNNFANSFTNNVIATINGQNISIANQEPDDDDYFVEGNGSISGSQISLDYTVTNPVGQETQCSTTWEIQ